MKEKVITLERVQYLQGPNIWTYRPVIEAWVDIGALEDFPSNTLPGFYERLTTWLPGLIEHRCGVGERGGFLQRLQEGTWAAHILEHVVLELQTLVGMRTGFGKTRQTAVPGLYKMAFRTRQEQVGRAALQHACELVMAAIHDQAFDLPPRLIQLRELVDEWCLGPSTAHIVEAATERGIPHIRLNDGNLVQLGYGARQRRIWTAETDQTSAIAEEIASDKDLTKSLLKSAGVPVPEGELVQTAEQAWQAAQDLGLPVVVKPHDGNHGRGVSLDLRTPSDVQTAFDLALREGDSSQVIVETYIDGHEHRLLVVGSEVVAAAKGEAAWVTGDGIHDVASLIDLQINTDPRRGAHEDAPLSRLVLAEQAEIVLELARQNLTGSCVPAAGQSVLIQRNGNVAFDVLDVLHPSVAATAVRAARVVGLDIAGVDMVLQDCSLPLSAQQGAVIEVNASPGLLAHLKPASGQARPVGQAIMRHLFGAEATAPLQGRIPLAGICSSQHGSLIARLLSWLLQPGVSLLGLACAEGLYLGSRCVTPQDARSWDFAQRVLINPRVDTAVFEHSWRHILNEGLPYDKCLVALVADAAQEQDLRDLHVDTPDKRLQLVRTPVDVVLPQGCAVLNADNAQVLALANLSDGQVLLYSCSPDNAALQNHLSVGGKGVYGHDRQLTFCHGKGGKVVLHLSEFPQLSNLPDEAILAACAAAWAMGADPARIALALRTFVN